MQPVRVVSHNVHAAALHRTVRPEGGHDHMTARFHGVGNLAHIGMTLFRRRQEMEDCAIVPYIVVVPLEGERRDIAAQPDHFDRVQSHSFFGYGDRCRRNIQHLKVSITSVQQIVNQRRLSTTHIHDPCIVVRARLLNQPQRLFQVSTVPVELGRHLGLIDLLPMRFGIGCRSSSRLRCSSS